MKCRIPVTESIGLNRYKYRHSLHSAGKANIGIQAVSLRIQARCIKVRLRACYVWVRKFKNLNQYIYFVLKTQRRGVPETFREAGLNVVPNSKHLLLYGKTERLLLQGYILQQLSPFIKFLCFVISVLFPQIFAASIFLLLIRIIYAYITYFF